MRSASSNPARPELFVQSALVEVLRPITVALTDRGVAVHCVDDVAAPLRSRPRQLVALSAFTDLQLVAVSRLAAERPLAAVIATVTDATGRQTHATMRVGATLVLNTLIPTPHLVDVLFTFARAYAHRPDLVDADPSRRPSGGTPTPESSHCLHRAAVGPADDDADLLRLLVGDATTAEIASQYHRSERSMYRRIRVLYTHVGVNSRQELRELSLHRPNTEIDPMHQDPALLS